MVPITPETMGWFGGSAVLYLQLNQLRDHDSECLQSLTGFILVNVCCGILYPILFDISAEA